MLKLLPAALRFRMLLAVHRALRGLLPALVVALPPLFWIVDGTNKASLTTLGRDQGIFQYIAWAIGKGLKDYRDVRDVNGPLTHLIHMVFLGLGGRDEHRFHVLDLAITGLTFGLVGACLPGIFRSTRVRLLERLGWAFAGWVVLSGQYLLYIFWDLAQRESFFDWFLLSGIGLQLVAQRQLAQPKPPRSAPWLLAVAGALVVLPCFGKPTYVFFTAAMLATLLVDNTIGLSRARRTVLYGAGFAAGAITQIAFLVAYADIGAFVKIYFVDVPVMYRFIWPRTVAEILSLPGNAITAALALVTSIVMLGLIVERQLPRRALGVAVLPLCGLASVVVQAKGFPYHFHPVTAGLHLQWLLLVVWLWEKHRGAPAGTFARVAPMLVAAALALRVAAEAPVSPHVQAIWIAEKGKYEEERESHDFLVYFQTHDFFPWEMRQTAAYLREHTKPTDRVQTYGMDPYVLFLAERLSATPYIYAYDLNADAALSGGMLRDGLHPTDPEQARIRALRDAHEADLLARLEREPPAAFVFLDKSPLITWQDAWTDFVEHNPKAATWVREHYRQTATYGDDHVWLRGDLADGIADVTNSSP